MLFDENSTDLMKAESSGFPHMCGIAALGFTTQVQMRGRDRAKNRFAYKASAVLAIRQFDLDGWQHATLETHDATGIGFGRVPADSEMHAFPAVGLVRPAAHGMGFLVSHVKQSVPSHQPCNNFKTDCWLVLACASTAVAACCMIWFLAMSVEAAA